VQRQLALWLEAEKPSQGLAIWQSLDPQARSVVITALSRVISKAVCPKNPRQTQEDKHEC
jgi:hypothetical protein